MCAAIISSQPILVDFLWVLDSTLHTWTHEHVFHPFLLPSNSGVRPSFGSTEVPCYRCETSLETVKDHSHHSLPDIFLSEQGGGSFLRCQAQERDGEATRALNPIASSMETHSVKGPLARCQPDFFSPET